MTYSCLRICRETSQFPLFTDENISPDVVAFLRAEGFDVLDVCENGWQGDPDEMQMVRVNAEARVIVTHDTDIGQLAWAGNHPFVGVVTLRPGDLPPSEYIRTLQTLLLLDPALPSPFLDVAKNTGQGKTILRIRQAIP